MLFPPFSFERTAAVPITSRFDAGACLLAQTGNNLGNTGRSAAWAPAVTSHNLARETERTIWRSIC
jgi:hypothetical protein